MILLLVILAAPLAQGDDRLLFQSATAEPYVMTLLDVSGSMAWQIDSPDFADGGIKTNRASADDPSSRLYLAKSAIYEVVQGLRPGVRLGFAHFNQRDFEVYRKHWLYQRSPQLTNADLPWYNLLPFPQAGDPIQFGRSVVDGNNADYRTCGNPNDNGNNAEKIGRLNIYPKLGHAGTTTTKMFTRYRDANGNNRRYEVTFFGLPADELGKTTIQVRVRVRQMRDDCTTRNRNDFEKTLTFTPFYTEDNEGIPFNGGFDYLSLQQSSGGSAGQPTVHNYGLGNILDAEDYEGCPSVGGDGWDPNGNNAHDLSFPDFADPHGRTCANNCFDRGDVLPLDWQDYPRETPDVGFELSNRDEFLRRLAPNTFVAGEFALDANNRPIPDFRIARYFENVPVNGRLPLKNQFANTPPLAVSRFARTPLREMMDSFADWFDDWKPVASDAMTGDPNFHCRETFVILLTDGVQTCNGSNPATATANLLSKGIRTFVVGFGAGVNFGQLQAMADAGGTGRTQNANGERDCEEFDICPGPIVAANRDALTVALNRIFGSIEPKPTSFASAAVPQAQAETQDSIFLTNFVPLDGRSVWPGSLLHFSRPLPLAVNNEGEFVPDTSISCAGVDPQVSCLAWDAGASLLNQAPTTAQVNNDNFKLGSGADQRRVYYSRDNFSGVPNTRMLFEPPALLSDKRDLWFGMQIPFDVRDPATEVVAEVQALNVIRRTLEQKARPDPANPNGPTLPFILGDIFHSDPVVLGAPERFAYFIENAGDDSTGQTCDDATNPSRGYRCFFAKHTRRRKVVFAGSNDGQLHAFNAGRFSGTVVDGRLEGEFGVGGGEELFSYIPRAVLPGVKLLATERTQRFTVDGPVVADDVFIDPVHGGTPTASEREWRTVLVGGLREGGKGYYALDVTQPDHLEQPPNQDPPAESVPVLGSNYVPSCDVSYNAAACGPVPFPTVLWEFTDDSDEELDANGNVVGNMHPDLGFTWSQPNVGRIEVKNGTAKPERKFVAVFGGGIQVAADETDQNRSLLNLVGNWLYMVDVETGQVIYKRQLDGAVPSGPAAVDVDLDGVLDRIYIGTTKGKLYKVDLTTPVDIDANSGRIEDPAWEPFAIFDTGDLPIFFPPSVIFVAELNQFALAFGTGEREDLWLEDSPPDEGRFYVILDNDFEPFDTAGDPIPPRTETAYQRISLTDLGNAGSDFLLDPASGTGSEHGWFLRLPDNERVITRAFSISGITVFSTFIPDNSAQVVNGQATCARAGSSNVYTVFTTSANALGQTPRFRNVEGFVSNPFPEVSASKNVDTNRNDPTSDDLTQALRDVMETLRELFPSNCKFANVTVNIKAVRSDTGVEFIAPVPVCVVEKNWKEF